MCPGCILLMKSLWLLRYQLPPILINQGPPLEPPVILQGMETTMPPLLLGRLAQACVEASLGKIGRSADLLIGIGGIAHVRRCPMLDDDVGIRIHRMLNDRLPKS